jgi:maleamate amidohydrolase
MAEHEDAGYGAREVGYGQNPAVLVVDFQTAFTDPQYELGRFEMIHRALEKTSELLKLARKSNIPVAKCYTAYESARDLPYWKVNVMHKDFFYGHPCTELDARIHDPDYDFTFCKSAPSIFFQTPLLTFLTKNAIDTTIITGCTTSGCVRASIIDSFSYGYRTIVPEDCVGDGAVEPHQANLLDVGRRYADITNCQSVIDYLQSRAAALSAA